MSRRNSRQERRDYYYDDERRDDRSSRYRDRQATSSKPRSPRPPPKSRAPYRSYALMSAVAVCLLFKAVDAKHHLAEPAFHHVAVRDSDRPLWVTNNCPDIIYPAILTQSGFGPVESGFALETGNSKHQTVSEDWRGRVWGRTNCTFDSNGLPLSGSGGAACQTGDCGQFIQCQGAGNPPATLAEFTLAPNLNQAYYDLSLVDSYNLPMGIIALLNPQAGQTAARIPPNLINPVCIATASLLAPIGDTSDALFGTNSSFPLPLEQTVTDELAKNWCPWPLLLQPPERPGNGVYPYPDGIVERPAFSPCYSACAKYNQPGYCCTGKYNSADVCRPSFYSTQAKKVCPDAYTYAFDDQASTFIIPQGGGFEVVFCPAGRSSNILSTFGEELRSIVQGS